MSIGMAHRRTTRQHHAVRAHATRSSATARSRRHESQYGRIKTVLGYIAAFVLMLVLSLCAAESLVSSGDLEVNPESPLTQLRGDLHQSRIDSVIEAQSGGSTAVQ